jgi:hypothetical protein
MAASRPPSGALVDLTQPSDCDCALSTGEGVERGTPRPPKPRSQVAKVDEVAADRHGRHQLRALQRLNPAT